MTCKLSYTQSIRWRIRLLWAALAAMLIFMVCIGEAGLRDSRVITGLAYTGGNLLYWGGLAWIIFRIAVNRRMLRDRARLKAQQLLEWDERNQHIHRMSGGWVMDAVLLMCYLATVVASCCNMAAFYAAFGLLTCAALLKAGAVWAYSRGML